MAQVAGRPRSQEVIPQHYGPEAFTQPGQTRTLADMTREAAKMRYKYPVMAGEQQLYDKAGQPLVYEAEAELPEEAQSIVLAEFLRQYPDVYTFDEVTERFTRMGPLTRPESPIAIGEPNAGFDLYGATAGRAPQPLSLTNPGLGDTTLPFTAPSTTGSSLVPMAPQTPTGALTTEGVDAAAGGFLPTMAPMAPTGVDPEQGEEPQKISAINAFLANIAPELVPGFVAGVAADTVLGLTPLAAAKYAKLAKMGKAIYDSGKLGRGLSAAGKFGTAMGVGAGASMATHAIQDPLVPKAAQEYLAQSKQDQPFAAAAGNVVGGNVLSARPGGTVAGRLITGGVSGGMNVGSQAVEVGQGKRKAINPMEVAGATAGGFAYGGRKGVSGAIADRVTGRVAGRALAKPGEGNRGQAAPEVEARRPSYRRPQDAIPVGYYQEGDKFYIRYPDGGMNEFGIPGLKQQADGTYAMDPNAPEVEFNEPGGKLKFTPSRGKYNVTFTNPKGKRTFLKVLPESSRYQKNMVQPDLGPTPEGPRPAAPTVAEPTNAPEGTMYAELDPVNGLNTAKQFISKGYNTAEKLSAAMGISPSQAQDVLSFLAQGEPEVVTTPAVPTTGATPTGVTTPAPVPAVTPATPKPVKTKAVTTPVASAGAPYPPKQAVAPTATIPATPAPEAVAPQATRTTAYAVGENEGGNATPTGATGSAGKAPSSTGTRANFKAGDQEGMVDMKFYRQPKYDEATKSPIIGEFVTPQGKTVKVKNHIPMSVTIPDAQAKDLVLNFSKRVTEAKAKDPKAGKYPQSLLREVLDATESVRAAQNYQGKVEARAKLLDQWGLFDLRDAEQAKLNQSQDANAKADAEAAKAKAAMKGMQSGESLIPGAPPKEGVDWLYHATRSAYYRTLAKLPEVRENVAGFVERQLRELGVVGKAMIEARQRVAERLRATGVGTEADWKKLEEEPDLADDLLVQRISPSTQGAGNTFDYSREGLLTAGRSVMTEQGSHDNIKPSTVEDAAAHLPNPDRTRRTAMSIGDSYLISRTGKVYHVDPIGTEQTDFFGVTRTRTDAIPIENDGTMIRIGNANTPYAGMTQQQAEQIIKFVKVAPTGVDMVLTHRLPHGDRKKEGIVGLDLTPENVEQRLKDYRFLAGDITADEWGKPISSGPEGEQAWVTMGEELNNPTLNPVRIAEIYKEIDTRSGDSFNGIDIDGGMSMPAQRMWMLDRIASHPNTPPDIMVAAGAFRPKALMENPALPFLLLEDPSLQTNPDLIRALDRSEDSQLRRALVPEVTPPIGDEAELKRDGMKVGDSDFVREQREKGRVTEELDNKFKSIRNEEIAFDYEQKARKAIRNMGTLRGGDLTAAVLGPGSDLAKAAYYKMMAGAIRTKPELFQYLSDVAGDAKLVATTAGRQIAGMVRAFAGKAYDNAMSGTEAGRTAQGVRQENTEDLMSGEPAPTGVTPQRSEGLIDRLINAIRESGELNAAMKADLKAKRAARAELMMQEAEKADSPLATYLNQRQIATGDYDHRLLMSDDNLLTPDDLNELLGAVQDYSVLTPLTREGRSGRINSTTNPQAGMGQWTSFQLQTALVRLAKDGVPLDRTAIHSLQRVFGSEITKRLDEIPLAPDADTRGKKLWEAMSAMRQLKTSLDIGTPFRNTIFHTVQHPVEAAAFMDNDRAFAVNPVKYQEYLRRMEGTDIGRLAAQADLAIPDTVNRSVAEAMRGVNGYDPRYLMKDDQHASSMFWQGIEEAGNAQKLQGDKPSSPLYTAAQGVMISERFHNSHLAQVRYAEFERLITKLDEEGYDPYNNIEVAKQAAQAVNVATGRADSLAGVKLSAEWMGRALFAPRYAGASVLTKSPLTPLYVAQQAGIKRVDGKFTMESPEIAKYTAKNMAAGAGAAVAVWSLVQGAKSQFGADVDMELDPRQMHSPNWGKLRIKDQYYDLGGATKWFKVFGQMVGGMAERDGQDVSTNTPATLARRIAGMPTGKIAKNVTLETGLVQLLRSLEAPFPALAHDISRGRSFRGQPYYTAKKPLEGAGRLLQDTVMTGVPIPFQQFVEGVEDQGVADGFKQMLLGMININTQPTVRKDMAPKRQGPKVQGVPRNPRMPTLQ